LIPIIRKEVGKSQSNSAGHSSTVWYNSCDSLNLVFRLIVFVFTCFIRVGYSAHF
jgi:hypothetical protein